MRAMITEAATADAPRQLNLAEAIRRRMAPLGGAGDLPPHPSANATVATRDTAGFENCGIAAINPWLPQ